MQLSRTSEAVITQSLWLRARPLSFLDGATSVFLTNTGERRRSRDRIRLFITGNDISAALSEYGRPQ
jgi:hypothetical protein